MSMMLTLRRVSADDIVAIRNDPDEVVPLFRDVDGLDDVVELANQRAMERAISSIDLGTWREYANTGSAKLELVAASLIEYLREYGPPPVPKAEYLDLDKSWHILHTLISGSPEPSEAPEASLLSGQELGPCGGYGPARLLTPDRVAAFSQVLDPLDAETLKSQADPERLRQLGVAFVQTDFDLEMIDYEIEDYFPKLKRFVARTVKNGRGLLTFLE